MEANGSLKLRMIDGTKKVFKKGDKIDENKVDPAMLDIMLKKKRIVGKALVSPSNKKMPTASNKTVAKKVTKKKVSKKGDK